MWTDGGGSCRGWGKVSGWKKRGGQRANRKGGRVPPADCRPKPCCSAGGANAGHRLQCMVKRRPKLFPARLLLSSLRGRWLPNWVGPLSLGIEHLSNEVVLYRRSNRSADKFTHVWPSKLCLKRQLSDHILCERQRSDAFPASVLHPDSEPRALFRCLHPDWLRK